MKSYKEKLIGFLRFKNDAIRSGTGLGLDLYDLSDFEEVASWSESLCKEVWFALDDTHGDGGTCPWCYALGFPAGEQCEEKGCTYGNRHGYCDDFLSRYQEVKPQLDNFPLIYRMVSYYASDMGVEIPPKLKKLFF